MSLKTNQMMLKIWTSNLKKRYHLQLKEGDRWTIRSKSHQRCLRKNQLLCSNLNNPSEAANQQLLLESPTLTIPNANNKIMREGPRSLKNQVFHQMRKVRIPRLKSQECSYQTVESMPSLSWKRKGIEDWRWEGGKSSKGIPLPSLGSMNQQSMLTYEK